MENRTVLVVQQQNNFIKLNSFGHEDVSHITPELTHQLLMQCEAGFIQLFKLIHFNADMPQNHNVRLESRKKNTVALWIDNKWEIESATTAVQKLVTNTSRYLQHTYLTDVEYMLNVRSLTDSIEDSYIPRFIDALNNNKSNGVRKIKSKTLDVLVEEWCNKQVQQSLHKLTA
jgi:hypothetical protein